MHNHGTAVLDRPEPAPVRQEVHIVHHHVVHGPLPVGQPVTVTAITEPERRALPRPLRAIEAPVARALGTIRREAIPAHRPARPARSAK
jgi:hypothetical protein